jgi:hypothetical protein
MLNDETPVSACMFFFGLTTLLQGFAQGFGGLVACRIFLGMFHINRNRQARPLILTFSHSLLGVFESGMFPGCFYLLAM